MELRDRSSSTAWIRKRKFWRSDHYPDGLDWGAGFWLGSGRALGNFEVLSAGKVRKVRTERGDYRGFYANVRDAIEKKALRWMCLPLSRRCARCVPLLLAHKSSREGRKVRWNEAP